MARVLIPGGGFAAVSAAETLVPAIGDEPEIILVSKSPDLTFYPANVSTVFGDARLHAIGNLSAIEKLERFNKRGRLLRQLFYLEENF